LLEAETNKYCPGGYDIGAVSNLITWVLNFFLSVCLLTGGNEWNSSKDDVWVWASFKIFILRIGR
jgi:hypothetical protein